MYKIICVVTCLLGLAMMYVGGNNILALFGFIVAYSGTLALWCEDDIVYKNGFPVPGDVWRN